MFQLFKINYLLFLQKKCQTRNKGSHRASAGKYLTSLISRYILWRLCPSCVFPKWFLSSYFPKFPASNTSFSTKIPYFSLEGTISREAGMPNLVLSGCRFWIPSSGTTQKPGCHQREYPPNITSVRYDIAPSNPPPSRKQVSPWQSQCRIARNQRKSFIVSTWNCTFARMKQAIRIILSYIAAIILLPIALLCKFFRRK